MCRNVYDDVKYNGYVCISHVWGGRKKYAAEEPYVINVSREILLSNSNKISIVKRQHLRKKYCWLCPLYTATRGQFGSLVDTIISSTNLTFVLSTIYYAVSDDLTV